MKQKPLVKAYLGESVYAQVNSANQLVLTTERGLALEQRIVLEPSVWTLLLSFCRTSWPHEQQRFAVEVQTLLQKTKP